MATTRSSSASISVVVHRPSATSTTRGLARKACARSSISASSAPSAAAAATAHTALAASKVASSRVMRLARASSVGRAANNRPGERGTDAGSKPSCSASCRHPMRRSNSETEWSLAWRVARVATSAALGPDVPFLRMCSVMAARRLLNRARTSAGTPTMSPVPSPDSSKLTPSLSTRPRRRRAWYTAVAALAWANSPALSMPVHRPSGPGVALATRTWVCSWGSPARLVWWTKAAPTIPPPTSKRTPRPWMPPRRTRQAWASRYSMAPATAASWAATTARTSSRSPRANRTETDLGAEKVAS